MGLDEIVTVLKQNKQNWMFARDIHKELDLSPSSISTNLKNLRKREAIKYKKTNSNGRQMWIYKYKEDG